MATGQCGPAYEARCRFERANQLADCPCLNGGVAIDSRLIDWSVSFEFWNTPDHGHLIAASLALDGTRCEDLP